MNIDKIQFDGLGLIPAIVQDATTKEVLTLAYMNQTSLEKSLETRETWFFSRSRQELWHKGETSGNTQKIVEMKLDCDQDAIVVLVNPTGPACHTGAISCFSESILKEEETVKQEANLADYQILIDLEQIIEQREKERPEGAYTTYLFTEGVDKILKKVGEEASEVIIAAKNRNPEELKWEASDLLYHLMVLLREQELPFKEILNVLEERHLQKEQK